jgi:RecB family exonuclease
VDAVAALGFLGGTRTCPDGALEWRSRLENRLRALDALLSAPQSAGTEREEERRGLERTRAVLHLLQEPLSALTTAAEPFVRGANITELWAATETVLREHIAVPGDGRRVVEALAKSMRALCKTPSIAALRGQAAHRMLEETVLALRLDSSRFGEPAITVATLEQAAGLPFVAVRVLGVAEGILPSSPREDPVLPDRHRAELRAYGVRSRADRVLAQLQALDRLVRHVSGRIVFSVPRRDIDGSYRELSSVALDVAVALGRGGVSVPTPRKLHDLAFAPANEAFTRSRGAAPLRESTWQYLAALRRQVPATWTERPHLDLRRGHALLEPGRSAGPLDGVFPATGGWFPVVPGSAPERPLSASRWRIFLECPHRFLYEALLGLRPPTEEPDDGELDPLTYGTLFHTVAERFYLRHGEAFRKRQDALTSFDAIAQRIADEAFAEVLEAHALAGSAVRAAQRERLHRDVRALLELDWDLPRDGVVGVERSFGFDEPLPLVAAGQTVYVRGYIDRIDLEQGAAVLRDLKTGKAKPRKDDPPDPSIDAQLAFYTLAARTLRERWNLPQTLAAAYVYPSAARHTDRAFRGVAHEQLETSARGWLAMTAGLSVRRSFPRTPVAKDCALCSFKPVCGPSAPSRAAEVIAANPGELAPFGAMKGR